MVEIDIWTVIYFASILGLILWVIAKLLGWIHSPVWVEMLPYSTIIFGIVAGTVKAGKYLQKIDGLCSKVDKIEGLCAKVDKIEGLCSKVDKIEGLCAKVDKIDGLCSDVQSLKKDVGFIKNTAPCLRKSSLTCQLHQS
jgi:outer membrane murein-binding lipoprotein Lpp